MKGHSDEAPFGWIDLERPIKRMFIQKKSKIAKEKEKEKNQKIGKKSKIKNQKEKKKKSLFSVVLDKMYVFCLYPILDSQQCVKRGSCRRPILSGLL